MYHRFCTLLLASLSMLSGIAQTIDGNEKRNQLKFNLTGVILNNYAIQYERITSQKVSLALGFRYMPTGNLPLREEIIEWMKITDADTKNTLRRMQVGGFAITADMRYYWGKGFGRGFFVAPFLRYESFRMQDLIVVATDGVGLQREVNMKGDFAGYGAGLMLGAQWFLGESLVLDWWIAGAYIGAGNGNITGTVNIPLTPGQQNDVRQQLNDIDIPFTNKTVAVNAFGADVKMDGRWGGVRAGLQLGIRF
jgi:hypothetical protein